MTRLHAESATRLPLDRLYCSGEHLPKLSTCLHGGPGAVLVPTSIMFLMKNASPSGESVVRLISMNSAPREMVTEGGAPEVSELRPLQA